MHPEQNKGVPSPEAFPVPPATVHLSDPVPLVAAAVAQEIWVQLQHTVGSGPPRGAAALQPLLDDCLQEWEGLRREIARWEPQEAEMRRTSFVEAWARRLAETLPPAPIVASSPTPVAGPTGPVGPASPPGPARTGKPFAPPHVSNPTAVQSPTKGELAQASAVTMHLGPCGGGWTLAAQRLEREHAADLPRDPQARAAFLAFVSDQGAVWAAGGRPHLGRTWQTFVQATHRAQDYAGLYLERALLAADCPVPIAHELVGAYGAARDALMDLREFH